MLSTSGLEGGVLKADLPRRVAEQCIHPLNSSRGSIFEVLPLWLGPHTCKRRWVRVCAGGVRSGALVDNRAFSKIVQAGGES